MIVFVNGHGGENFLKFRVTPNVSDNRKEREELTSEILYSTITDMFYLKRYKEILIILDTCQAASLIPKVLKEREFTIQRLPPHSTFFSSSSIHEESFSYGYNPEVLLQSIHSVLVRGTCRRSVCTPTTQDTKRLQANSSFCQQNDEPILLFNPTFHSTVDK